MLLLAACSAPNLGEYGEVSPTISSPARGASPAAPGGGGAGGGPEGDGGLLYGDELLDLELELTEESIDLLARSSSQGDDAPWVPAVFRYGDESLDVTALRERLADVVTWWRTGELRAEYEAARALTEEACLADPRSDVGAEGCATARDLLDAYLTDRPAQLEEGPV